MSGLRAVGILGMFYSGSFTFHYSLFTFNVLYDLAA